MKPARGFAPLILIILIGIAILGGAGWYMKVNCTGLWQPVMVLYKNDSKEIFDQQECHFSGPSLGFVLP